MSLRITEVRLIFFVSSTTNINKILSKYRCIFLQHILVLLDYGTSITHEGLYRYRYSWFPFRMPSAQRLKENERNNSNIPTVEEKKRNPIRPEIK